MKKIFVLLIAPLLIGLNIYSSNLNQIKTIEKKNVSQTLSEYDTNGTIFYSQTSKEVLDYYSSINVGDSGDLLLDKLQELLKLDPLSGRKQAKVDYSSGSSKSSTSWNGYYLYERDYKLSPLTEQEISSGNYKTNGIWLNALYCHSPIYIDYRVNNGNFKYYTDWNSETYSGTNIATGKFVSSSVQFDREHVTPKSFGFNGANDKYKSLTVGCDAHNLHMGEHEGNSSAHSNLPYGTVVRNSTTYYSKITNEVVGYVGYNKDNIKVFEPCDEDKGDIARTCFYMAARYHNFEKDINDSNYYSPSLTLEDKVTAIRTTEPEETQNNPCAYGELTDLLEWNKSDPVSEEEIRRNDLIYNGIQYNRNPFIDFPSWADACFSNQSVKFDDINIRKEYLGEKVDPSYQIVDSITTSLGLKYSNEVNIMEDLKDENSINSQINYSISSLINNEYYVADQLNTSKKLASICASEINPESAKFNLIKESQGYLIKCNNQYLTYSGSGTNIEMLSTPNDYSYWNLSYQSDGFIITNTKETSRALLFRKGSYNYFGAYSLSNLNSTEYFKLQLSCPKSGDSEQKVCSNYYLKYQLDINNTLCSSINENESYAFIIPTQEITNNGYESLLQAYIDLNDIQKMKEKFASYPIEKITQNNKFVITSFLKNISELNFSKSYSCMFYIDTPEGILLGKQIDYSVDEMISIYYQNQDNFNEVQKEVINKLYQDRFANEN